MLPHDPMFEHFPLATFCWPQATSLNRPSGGDALSRVAVFNLVFRRLFCPASLPDLRAWADGTHVRRLDTRIGRQRICRFSLRSLPDGRRLAVVEDMQSFYQDALTKLDDRRALLLDTASPLVAGSLALLDIDQFKAVNDALGHAAGDAALCVLAELLCAAAHTWGMRAYRLSGDEFVLLGDVALNASTLAAVQAEFAAALRCLGQSEAHSFSYGLASAPDDGQTLSSLLARADSCLRASKGCQRRGDGVGQLERIMAHLEIRDAEVVRPLMACP